MNLLEGRFLLQRLHLQHIPIRLLNDNFDIVRISCCPVPACHRTRKASRLLTIQATLIHRETQALFDSVSPNTHNNA